MDLFYASGGKRGTEQKLTIWETENGAGWADKNTHYSIALLTDRAYLVVMYPFEIQSGRRRGPPS